MSDERRENVVSPSRPQILICGENMRDSIPTQSGKYGAILGARWSRMKEFYVTVLKKKKAISEDEIVISNIRSVETTTAQNLLVFM